MLAVGNPIDVRNVHPQSLRNASVVKTDVLFVKIEQGLSFLFARPLLLGLRVNRTGATHFRREVVLVRPPDWFLRALAKLGAAFGFRLT
jgi:hypothetical protein